jgi:transposase-like protein
MGKATKKLAIRENRSFSEAFKKGKVKDLIEKRMTITELSRYYHVTRSAVYKWLYKYSPHHKKGTTLVVQMESEEQKTKHYTVCSAFQS